MLTLGTLKLWLIAVLVSVLLFLGIWFYKKLKTGWYRKGLDDANEDCNKRLIHLHNDIAAGKLPDGMQDSGKTWRVPGNATPNTMESSSTDGSGGQAGAGQVSDKK